MSRYHYSRNAPHSATSRSESLGPRQYSSGHLARPTATLSTTASSSNLASPGSAKSNYIPLVRQSRSSFADKRDFIPIPIKREEGTFVNNPSVRTIPITFLNETTSLLPNTSHFLRDFESPPRYASLLRPSPKYSQPYSNSNHHKDDNDEPTTTVDTLARLPAVPRRLSLTIPVMTTTTSTSTADGEASKQNVSIASVRPSPIRLSQPSSAASIPTNSTRLSSAIVRSSPSSNLLPNHLQRQKSDLVNGSFSSDFTNMPVNTSPVRRAEVMAREAIQGIARYQQHQQHHQTPLRTNSLSDNNSDTSGRSPLLSRRVIVNLKNNQSVSLDSRISPAGSLSAKLPTNPPSSRSSQRNNLYHVPVLHEIQVPPHPANIAAESFLHVPRSSTSTPRNTNNYKNEFRMEIPVTVMTHTDQENFMQQNFNQADGLIEYDPQVMIISERRPSLTSRQALKSILKRSASRDTVLRKNVSFMNA